MPVALLPASTNIGKMKHQASIDDRHDDNYFDIFEDDISDEFNLKRKRPSSSSMKSPKKKSRPGKPNELPSSHSTQNPEASLAHVSGSAPVRIRGYDPVHPRIPNYILQHIMDFTKERRMSERRSFLVDLSRYWALKREARRGAPLLRRLHLEPWTASVQAHKEDEKARAHRWEFLQALRKDLEKVRLLCDAVKKREKKKLKSYEFIDEYLQQYFQPIGWFLRNPLDALMKYV